MSHLRLRLLQLAAVLALMAGSGAQAQSTASLEPFIPVEGHIEPGMSQIWEFTAWDGAALTFVVQATSPNFDPVIHIQTSAGVELIANDDYNYPNSHDALLEAITIPRFDTYRAIVSGLGNTSGDYVLTMQPGYAHIANQETFNGSSVWRRQQDVLGLEISDGQLTLSLAGIGETATAVDPESPRLLDFYTQAHISEITGRNGWIIGLTARQQDDGSYIAVEINHQGFWRLVYSSPNGVQVIQDWTSHPAIVPGEASFTLGLLANGTRYEVFYSGQFVGQANSSEPATAGHIGLVIGTFEALGSETLATFDDLVTTDPLLIDGATILPQMLVRGDTTTTVQELQRRHLIPAEGILSLVVGESFIQNNRPGVSRIGLGRGKTFENFALGTDVSWQTLSAGLAGCGVYLRATGDDHYALAYVDQTGGYGLAQRDGDTFLPGIFSQETAAWSSEPHALLVIAKGDMLYYYIDEQYRGTLTYPAASGEMGNAVVNFEAIDTTCQFNDTWLWSWD